MNQAFPLTAISDSLAEAVERAAPAVVAVHARHRFSSSGVWWRPGVAVTADHTIKQEEEISLTLPDGRDVAAKLAGRDPGTDVAVLRVEGADAPPPEFAPADTGKVGHVVLALGRSRESGVCATMGVISALAGPWHTWRGGQLDRYVRLDLTLYPGSSGGAVIDASGRVLGIATSALSRLAGVVIPVSTVERVAEQLLSRGRVPRGYLGVGLQPVGLPAHLISKLKLSSQTGVIVLMAEPGGPAERAGVLVGDVLLALDGQPVNDVRDVQGVLGAEYVGKTVQALILRGGELTEAGIVVAERPRRQ
jgi:S1-C subfamily serine protease